MVNPIDFQDLSKAMQEIVVRDARRRVLVKPRGKAGYALRQAFNDTERTEAIRKGWLEVVNIPTLEDWLAQALAERRASAEIVQGRWGIRQTADNYVLFCVETTAEVRIPHKELADVTALVMVAEKARIEAKRAEDF